VAAGTHGSAGPIPGSLLGPGRQLVGPIGATTIDIAAQSALCPDQGGRLV